MLEWRWHIQNQRWCEWKIRAFRVSIWPSSFFEGTCDPFPDYHRNVQCSKRWLMMSWGSIRLPFIYWGWWEYKNGESPPASIILVGGLEHVFFSIYWEFHHPNWLFFRGVETTNQNSINSHDAGILERFVQLHSSSGYPQECWEEWSHWSVPLLHGSTVAKGDPKGQHVILRVTWLCWKIKGRIAKYVIKNG